MNELMPTRPTTQRIPRDRFSPAPMRRMCIEERDRLMLLDLFHHQAMLRSHIQELYFTSVARCNDRLRHLFDHGFVRRYYHPASPYGAQAIYLAGSAGIPIIAAELGIDVADVRRRCGTKTPGFLEHTLEIVAFYLATRRACAADGRADLDLWLPESSCRHEYQIARNTAKWHKEVFKPDAFVRLSLQQGDEYRSYFVEIDMGHTSARQFLAKLAGHSLYLQSGLFEERFGCALFNTLVVTTGKVRLRNLLSLVQGQGSCLFWFTTFDDIRAYGTLAPIWHVPFVSGTLDLLAECDATKAN